MTDELGEHTVVFQTPWHQRAWDWMSVAIAFFFVALFIPGMVWGVVGFSRVWQSPPWWWHLIGLSMFALGAGLVVRFSRDALTKRLVVGEQGWRLEGLRSGPLMQYEKVSLLQLEDDDKSTGLGKTRKLVLELRGGDRRSIWLRDRDARECLDAMHELCRHAIAINPEGEARLPVDEQMHVLAHLTLAKRYRRRGWLAVLGAAALLMILIIRAWVWLVSAGPQRPITSLLISSGIHLVSIVALAVFAVGWFRAARAHAPSFKFVSLDEPDGDNMDDD